MLLNHVRANPANNATIDHDSYSNYLVRSKNTRLHPPGEDIKYEYKNTTHKIEGIYILYISYTFLVCINAS